MCCCQRRRAAGCHCHFHFCRHFHSDTSKSWLRCRCHFRRQHRFISSEATDSKCKFMAMQLRSREYKQQATTIKLMVIAIVDNNNNCNKLFAKLNILGLPLVLTTSRKSTAISAKITRYKNKSIQACNVMKWRARRGRRKDTAMSVNKTNYANCSSNSNNL